MGWFTIVLVLIMFFVVGVWILIKLYEKGYRINWDWFNRFR